MNFLDSFQTCYKKIFNYKGRASKSEYWWFQLYISLLTVLTYKLLDQSNPYGEVLVGLWAFNNLPLLAAAIRRFHDMNKSGWMLLYSFIPLVGSFIVLIMLLGDGTKGKNEFGPKPKK